MWWTGQVDARPARSPDTTGTMSILFTSSTHSTVCSAEQLDHLAHTSNASAGRWLLPILQLCTSAAVIVARKIDAAERSA